LNAELTNTHSFRLFFGDFANWENLTPQQTFIVLQKLMYKIMDHLWAW